MRHAWTRLAVLAALAGGQAHARPVSYEGGWTAIEKTDRQATSLWVHHTLNPRLSLGYRGIWDRRADALFQGVQATALVKRWFGKDYQANLYGFGAVGAAVDVRGDRGYAPAAFLGAMADWETRRWFLAYRAQFFEAGDIERAIAQIGRIGFAPYVGDAGDLHTWLMVEIDHRPENPRAFGVTPLLRFFKGPALLELGLSVTDDTPQPLANFTFRF